MSLRLTHRRTPIADCRLHAPGSSLKRNLKAGSKDQAVLWSSKLLNDQIYLKDVKDFGLIDNSHCVLRCIRIIRQGCLSCKVFQLRGSVAVQRGTEIDQACYNYLDPKRSKQNAIRALVAFAWKLSFLSRKGKPPEA